MEKKLFDIYMVVFKCVLCYIAFVMFDIFSIVGGNITVIILMVAFFLFLFSSFGGKMVKSSKLKSKHSNKYHFHSTDRKR